MYMHTISVIHMYMHAISVIHVVNSLLLGTWLLLWQRDLRCSFRVGSILYWNFQAGMPYQNAMGTCAGLQVRQHGSLRSLMLFSHQLLQYTPARLLNSIYQWCSYRTSDTLSLSLLQIQCLLEVWPWDEGGEGGEDNIQLLWSKRSWCHERRWKCGWAGDSGSVSRVHRLQGPHGWVDLDMPHRGKRSEV